VQQQHQGQQREAAVAAKDRDRQRQDQGRCQPVGAPRVARQPSTSSRPSKTLTASPLPDSGSKAKISRDKAVIGLPSQD
jgi:hypothetical protein